MHAATFQERSAHDLWVGLKVVRPIKASLFQSDKPQLWPLPNFTLWEIPGIPPITWLSLILELEVPNWLNLNKEFTNI